jgi:membrane protease YdiL (CAAX protease family)
MLVMACIAAPVSEEAAFRGYCATILERRFGAPSVILISSLLFALAHFTQGLVLAKLVAYFLAGLLFAGVAHAAKSIWASIPVHSLADLIAFILLWPYDSSRHLVSNGGADAWFWIHAAQAIIFTVITVLLLRNTSRIARAESPVATSASF